MRLLALLLLMAAPAAAAELVMVEEQGCIYCARWDAEIAPAYPLTPEGRAAPLRRIDIHALPDDLTFDSAPRITPTFVLIDDGQEVARLEGYPGDEFFWPLLGQMLDQLPE
jgi:thioredoxin-related protein